jgi:hypothetical protein
LIAQIELRAASDPGLKSAVKAQLLDLAQQQVAHPCVAQLTPSEPEVGR